MTTLRLFGETFPANQLCIVCHHVLQGDPIVELAHDLDGVLQVFCHRHGHGGQDVAPVGLGHIAQRLRDTGIDRLPPNYYATRAPQGWAIALIPPDD